MAKGGGNMPRKRKPILKTEQDEQIGRWLQRPANEDRADEYIREQARLIRAGWGSRHWQYQQKLDGYEPVETTVVSLPPWVHIGDPDGMV